MKTAVSQRDSTDPWEPQHGQVWRVVRAEGPPTMVPGDGDRPLLAYAEEVREVFGSILALAQQSRDGKGGWEYLIPGRATGGHLLPADVAAVRKRVDAQFRRVRGFLEEIIRTPVDGTCSEAYLDFLGLLVQVHLPDRPEHWHVTDEGLTLSNWGLEQGIPVFPTTAEVANTSLRKLTACWNTVNHRLATLEADARDSEEHWNRHVIPTDALPTADSTTPAKDHLQKRGVDPATVTSSKVEQKRAPDKEVPPPRDESGRGQGTSDGAHAAGHFGNPPLPVGTPTSRPLAQELTLHLAAAILAVVVAAILLWRLELLPPQVRGESASIGVDTRATMPAGAGEESSRSKPAEGGGNESSAEPPQPAPVSEADSEPPSTEQASPADSQESVTGGGSVSRLLPESCPIPAALITLHFEPGPGIDRAVHILVEPLSSTPKDLA